MIRIKEKIYDKYFRGFPTIRVSDLPNNLEPNDIIDIERIEGYCILSYK